MLTLTHNNLAKMFMPHIPMKNIRLVNNVIDNPSRVQKQMQNSYMYNSVNVYHNLFDVFGLGKRAHHRRFNHDVASAALAGYMSMGQNGMQVSMIHLMADYWSDILKIRYGRRGRDIWEAMFNYYM